MEDLALKQPVMVSRLPKFGSRAPAAAVPNGSALPVSCGAAKGLPAGKQNGVVRLPPPLSLKGKKGSEDGGEKFPDAGEDVCAPPRSAAAVREIRKPAATLAGKASRTTSAAAGTLPRTPPQSARANLRTTAPKPLFPGQPLGLGRTAVNGVSGTTKPGAASTLPALSQSNDSLRSLPVENVVRSRSFSYLKSPASSCVGPGLTRSFSFNRATELAKELPRPLAQSPLARSPVTHPSLPLASERAGAFGFAKPALAPFPPATQKKSHLPSCSGSKPSALSYRLTRPSLIKQPRPSLAGKVQAKAESTQREACPQAVAPPMSEPSSKTGSAETTPDEPSSTREAVLREVPEDMSLSSTSSLERNDISEEYMDDFDDLGNGGGAYLLPARGRDQAGLCEDDNTLVGQFQEGSSITSLHNFLSETVDWAEMGLTGSREVIGSSPRCMSEVLSASGDAPHGSSLDLSPSDSSGGTYMWDEEVLEPLEGVPHGAGSYDSDLNSMDILNNLENLESCDLEEDDLMLDVDLPEDTSLHSDVDGMYHYECSERGYWPWRRPPQCWGRQDKLHNHTRGAVLCSGDDELSYLGRREAGEGALDELMLKHMTQDCSYVKEQLLQLRRLLQTEEDGPAEDDVGESPASTSSEDSSCQQQVVELLKEVQNLREELRRKECVITQLSQQMSTSMDVTQCHCPQGEPQAHEHQDKGTQTPWRVQTPQILQLAPESPSRHQDLETPSSRVHTGAPSDRVDARPADSPMRSRSCPLVPPASSVSNAVVPSAVPAAANAALSSSLLRDSVPDKLSLLPDTHSRIGESRIAVVRGGKPRADAPHLPFVCVQRTSFPQGPRANVRFGSGREAAGRASLRPDSASPSWPRHLPPPSRGLPSISYAPQAADPSARPPHAPPARGAATTPRDVEPGPSRNRPSFSRLPTPKNH